MGVAGRSETLQLYLVARRKGPILVVSDLWSYWRPVERRASLLCTSSSTSLATPTEIGETHTLTHLHLYQNSKLEAYGIPRQERAPAAPAAGWSGPRRGAEAQAVARAERRGAHEKRGARARRARALVARASSERRGGLPNAHSLVVVVVRVVLLLSLLEPRDKLLGGLAHLLAHLALRALVVPLEDRLPY